ncbi:MAG: malate synthase G, partial [Boseongicola sp.]|nr:malate synthase G [Boseongicola sp.]
MVQRETKFGLSVDPVLADFIDGEALPGTGVGSDDFWSSFASIVSDLAPRNAELIAKREDLQSKIDAWHRANPGLIADHNAYQSFLKEIGYLVPEGDDFEIETKNVDPEIATTPGPQLVVPITNARYALNAANARWGSLYDALYGTDALGDLPEGKAYDPARGARVIEWAKSHIDQAVPLANGSWKDVTSLSVEGGTLNLALADQSQFLGHASQDGHSYFLFQKNGLLIEVVVDPSSAIGADDPAGIADVNLEAAVSAIMDCEDSVACVDAEDKTQAYRNWLGLMKGDLAEEVTKSGKTFTRKLNPDFDYTAVDGGQISSKRRALMLVRNVGHLMTNPAIMLEDGSEIPEGLMDAMVTTMIAMHDLRKTSGARNSLHGSVYVVKPKMHGPEEVEFACEIFDRVEAALGLPANTVKLGIMDEERRTSANLKECIRAAKHRVAFI